MAKRTDYNVSITSASKELTTMDKLFITSSPAADTIDSVMQDCEKLLLDIDWFCICDIHNEHANDDKDYSTLYIITKDEQVYKSSSNSLITSLEDILTVLADSDEGLTIADVPIVISKHASKSYSGKFFYRASVGKNK